MKVPMYVIEILGRSKYEYDLCKNNENYAAGYTLRVRKATPYTKVETFKAELERLCKWVNKVAGFECAFVLDVPSETHYLNQAAAITIFDPVMQKIEKFIN